MSSSAVNLLLVATPDSAREAGASAAAGAAPEWSREQVEDLAHEALATVGLPPARTSLVKFRGTFASLRVERPRLLLKIGSSEWSRGVLDRSLRVSAWLADSGFPVAAAAAETSTGPLPVRGRWAGLWRWEEHDPGRRPDPRAIGELLRSLHELLERCPVPLQPFDPLGAIRKRQATLTGAGSWLDRPCREFLASRLERLAGRWGSFAGELGGGPIHGDLKLSNVLLTRRGPLLVDFDNCSRGPREWDLSLLARANAKGWSRDQWPRFAAGYGYDLLARRENDPLREHAYLRTLLRWLSYKQDDPRRERGRKLVEEWRRNPGKACFELDWRRATAALAVGP